MPIAHGRALIVVDVQNDFCEGGALAVPGGATVAAGVSAHLAQCRGDYSLVVATRDWHIDPLGHFALPGTAPDYASTWPRHCICDSIGAAFHPALLLPEGTIIVSKGHHEAAYSGFEGKTDSGSTLSEVLAEAGISAIDVVGLATSFCVKATALDGVAHGFDTRVLGWLCADVAGADTAATVAALCAAGVGAA